MKTLSNYIEEKLIINKNFKNPDSDKNVVIKLFNMIQHVDNYNVKDLVNKLNTSLYYGSYDNITNTYKEITDKIAKEVQNYEVFKIINCCLSWKDNSYKYFEHLKEYINENIYNIECIYKANLSRDVKTEMQKITIEDCVLYICGLNLTDENNKFIKTQETDRVYTCVIAYNEN